MINLTLCFFFSTKINVKDEKRTNKVRLNGSENDVQSGFWWQDWKRLQFTVGISLKYISGYFFPDRF